MMEADAGTSFDWDSSPQCLFRPSCPPLSAHSHPCDDSESSLFERDNGLKRSFLTSLSPLFGASRVSLESSCCSALNNAVILDDLDESETVPTDEKEKIVGSAAVRSVPRLFSESVSQLNLDLSPIEPREASPVVSILAEVKRELSTPFAVSPGPQWSPGVFSGKTTPVESNNQLIHLKSNLHLFSDDAPEDPPTREGSASPAEEEVSSISSVEVSPVRVLSHLKRASDSSILLNMSRYRKRVESTEERQVREAEEGRRILFNQIEINRRNFNKIRNNSDNCSNFSILPEKSLTRTKQTREYSQLSLIRYSSSSIERGKVVPNCLGTSRSRIYSSTRASSQIANINNRSSLANSNRPAWR
jgi:hypothetical protein